MKNKYIDWLLVIISIILIIEPFILGSSFEHKILLPTAGVGILARFIENKKIRYAVISICLLVVLFVLYRWYL